METDRRGRPRLVASRRPGSSARDEILDAAAELFTTVGYAATSTRRIADSVGIRQASLYHHFAAKDDILDALLAGTVDASMELAVELLAEDGPMAPRLHTLVVADTAQLCGGAWNLGTLYLLPDLRVERFAAFHRRRGELRSHYRELSRAVIAEHNGAPDANDLPFRLVEAVINRRSDDGACPSDYPWTTAEAALRVLGCASGFARMRAQTASRLASPPE
ncbi:TetR/AcrR family transcriptional regulator [[Mycobacterium] nativiensis]|uniref:Helix-turn-helix domain-containing protein n=1 Tax=[Mycobacterium] nativiensis TaxID=2855503 RepID=A0ABU5XXH4_9MYCO|nr:TetR/AcrR family transcriptional regulator [Mycolicibacter sp. MYC340]MEB3032628.1 helix-turn-helix domain-containing protein [Mycolicibacter sp. MYC340]